MALAELNAVAEKMVAAGRGILAADESTGTIKKRFDAIGVENTEPNRRDYRELMFRSAGMQYVSGVILYDETIWQDAADGTPLVDVITQAGSIPGIKVDEGIQPLHNFPGETITVGLDRLAERLAKYHAKGARFAKWRAVIDITDNGVPTAGAIKANAHALARYAALCQAADIVPIVEPEVLMDGAHDLQRCEDVTRRRAEDHLRRTVGRPRRPGRHGVEAEHDRGRQGLRQGLLRGGGGPPHPRRAQGHRA